MHLEILPNFLAVVAAFAKPGALHEVARVTHVHVAIVLSVLAAGS